MFSIIEIANRCVKQSAAIGLQCFSEASTANCAKMYVHMKQPAIIFGVIAVIGLLIIYFLIQGLGNKVAIDQTPTTNPPSGQTVDQSTTQTQGSSTTQMQASTTDTGSPMLKKQSEVIGKSVDGRDITAYHYGAGDTEVLFIGGIHGGYSWNTVALAYQLMDYLAQNPNAVPSNERVTIIPDMNPDGLYKIAGTDGRVTQANITVSEADTVPGRFNADNVDLNRNFDCDWQATGVWQKQTVSGGTAAFSEPESQAIRDYVQALHPKAVVVWYSAAGGVYASNCHNGVLPETSKLTSIYSLASGYPASESFDFYSVTGDMVNWLAKESIPAISVLLTNHTDTEWNKNLAGVQAVLQHYAQ